MTSTLQSNLPTSALRTLQGFPYFSPTCLCQEPHRDPECNQIREYLFDHPCGIVNTKESDPYPIDALPTCNQALSVCQKDRDCKKIYENFQQACKVQNGQCQMGAAWQRCQSAWSQLRLSPMFGCICPGNSGKEKCDRVFKAVNGNPCIGKLLIMYIIYLISNMKKAVHIISTAIMYCLRLTYFGTYRLLVC
jgi:trimethyllysine dioxygenase